MQGSSFLWLTGCLGAGLCAVFSAGVAQAQPSLNPPPVPVRPRTAPRSNAAASEPPMGSTAGSQPSIQRMQSGAPAGGSQPPMNGRQGAAPQLDETVRREARLHFRLGVDFYRERDFRAALIEFRRAYEIAPHYTVLFNLGQTAIELKEYVLALDYLSRYLTSGGDAIAPLRREEVQAMMEDLAARTALVTVHADQFAGAELRLDSETVGRLPLKEPIRVSVGRREFSAVVRGREVARKVVDVAAADSLSVQLELRAPMTPPDMAGSPVEVPHEYEAGGVGWPLVVAGVSTSVFAVSAGVMTYATAATAQRYEDVRTGTEPVSVGRFKHLRNLSKRMAWVTDGLYLATLLSGTVTAILWATDDDEDDAEAIKPGVQVGLSPDQLWVQGRF